MKCRRYCSIKITPMGYVLNYTARAKGATLSNDRFIGFGGDVVSYLKVTKYLLETIRQQFSTL